MAGGLAQDIVLVLANLSMPVALLMAKGGFKDFIWALLSVKDKEVWMKAHRVVAILVSVVTFLAFVVSVAFRRLTTTRLSRAVTLFLPLLTFSTLFGWLIPAKGRVSLALLVLGWAALLSLTTTAFFVEGWLSELGAYLGILPAVSVGLRAQVSGPGFGRAPLYLLAASVLVLLGWKIVLTIAALGGAYVFLSQEGLATTVAKTLPLTSLLVGAGYLFYRRNSDVFQRLTA